MKSLLYRSSMSIALKKAQNIKRRFSTKITGTGTKRQATIFSPTEKDSGWKVKGEYHKINYIRIDQIAIDYLV